MCSGPIPISFDRFGVEVDFDFEQFREAVHDVAREPELVRHVDAVAGADLDLVLAAQHFCVGARDSQTCLEAVEHQCVREFAPEGHVTTY